MIDHARPRDPASGTGRPGGHDHADDTRLAADLAAGAGAVLLDLRGRVDAGSFSGDALDLRTAGDAAAQAYLASALAAARPTDGILSEEARDDRRRVAMDRVWIVDPLDGTREFAERGDDGTWRDDFAVHVALWIRDRGISAAAVALPACGRVIDTDATTTPDPMTTEAVLAGRRPLRIAASRTRPPALAARLAELDDVELVPMGSTGAKAMAVLDGRVDAYVHAGGQYEWDSAAPVAVAIAAGYVATRLDGTPVAYNQSDPWSPDLMICHPALVGHLSHLIERVGVDADVKAPAWP